MVGDGREKVVSRRFLIGLLHRVTARFSASLRRIREGRSGVHRNRDLSDYTSCPDSGARRRPGGGGEKSSESRPEEARLDRG